MAYTRGMFKVIKSDEFNAWLSSVRDKAAYARILARIRNAGLGNLGDWKSLRDGISEMRIDVGAGYRLYFTRRGDQIIVLLCGGDKGSQKTAIKRAIELAQGWKE
jgi:putative addiction module killer protein